MGEFLLIEFLSKGVGEAKPILANARDFQS